MSVRAHNVIAFTPTQQSTTFLTLKEVTSFFFLLSVVERKTNLGELFAILARQSLGTHFSAYGLSVT